jgi:HAD superfamily hydrolase (TIGR01490 family)
MARSHRARRPSRVGAFFDMDKTLLSENSGALYMRYRYRRGEISRVEVLKGIGTYLQYKLGLLDIERWTKDMMLQFRGHSERELEEEALVWVREMVVQTIYPEARALVREHLDRGDVVAIVSGATRFVVRPIALHLDIEHMLYTHLEVEDGRFTGRIVEPICFEDGKVFWLQQFIEEHHVDLARSYFYTDSVTDLPLLALVGHPMVTNPDPFLYRAAVKRCWPVRFFDPPDSDRPVAVAVPPRSTRV